MADNSHALRKIKQRLQQRPIVFSLGDALNQAEIDREDRTCLVLGVDVEQPQSNEDCEIKGCACKR